MESEGKVAGMQIENAGKNGKVPGGSGIYVSGAHERPGRKNGSFVSGESFQDRLQKNINQKAAFLPAAEPQGTGMQVKRCRQLQGAREVEVRRIPYSACDKVEINVLEGYTLKAKLEKGEGGRKEQPGSVYVEMKEDSGFVKAFLFDAEAVSKNSRSAVERIAYEEVMEQGRQGTT